MTRIWKCDTCGESMDDQPSCTASLLIELHCDSDSDDDDEGDAFEVVEYHFCTLACLAQWAMREVLEHTEQQ